MIDIDETEKQVKLLQSKSFIRMQLDLPEVLELIERVRDAEAHRLAWAEREVLRSIERDDARDGRDAALARIAEAAKHPAAANCMFSWRSARMKGARHE